RGVARGGQRSRAQHYASRCCSYACGLEPGLSDPVTPIGLGSRACRVSRTRPLVALPCRPGSTPSACKQQGAHEPCAGGLDTVISVDRKGKRHVGVSHVRSNRSYSASIFTATKQAASS